MNINDTTQYLPLIGALLYTVLIIMPRIRRGQEKQQTTWLLVTILLSIVWEFSLFLESQIKISNLALIVLIFNTCAIGGTTSAYIEKNPSKKMLTLIALAILSVIVAMVDRHDFRFHAGSANQRQS